MHIDPRSASELVRATAILALRILHAQPGEWTQDERSQLRVVELQVAIDDVIKGEVTARTATIQVQQRRADAVMDYMGLWFRVPLDPGGRLTALSSSPSHDPVEILREGPCDKLYLEPKEQAEVRLAVELEARDPPLGALLDDAFAQRAERGPIFVRWLWDRVQPEAFRSPAAFGRLTDLIVDEKTDETARETLANVAYQRLQEAGLPLPAQRALLVRALLRTLALPGAAGFHPNAEGVLLRNLLALDKKPVATADQIYLGHAAERARATAVLKGRPASVGRDRLITWIQPAATSPGP